MPNAEVFPRFRNERVAAPPTRLSREQGRAGTGPRNGGPFDLRMPPPPDDQLPGAPGDPPSDGDGPVPATRRGPRPKPLPALASAGDRR